MRRVPHVVHVAYEIGSLFPRAIALVRLQTDREILTGTISISGRAEAQARLGLEREPFLRELASELCRIGMHSNRCFHVSVKA